MKKNYNFFKNSKYAIEGFFTLLKEKAFLIEISFIVPLIILLLFLDKPIIYKIVMFVSLMIVLVTEALNTAVEYVVDLVTDEWHILAKKAKDTASAAVMISITQAVAVWGLLLSL